MKRTITILILICMFSCEEIINEQNITKKSVKLLAPTENVILKKGTEISFNWQLLDGAANYELQLAIPNFSNANQMVIDTLIQRNNFTIDSLATNSYEWRVKGKNTAYETGYTTNGFIVGSEEP